MKRTLDEYAAKRKFARTPEPGPKVARTGRGPLLFVVQKHAARRLHYDFRLEVDGVLKSWAVPKGPSLDPADKRLAVPTEDHPYDYASFEGVIPEKEYGAGNVIVWDCGVYSPDEGGAYAFDDRRAAEERVRTELAAGKLSIFLRGEKLKGSFALVRTSTDGQWLLIKHQDRYAHQNDVLAMARSVLSGRTVEERPADRTSRVDAARLAPTGPAEAMPKALSPMLAEIGEAPRAADAWAYEPKVDGYRVLAFVRDGTVRLQSRRGLDLTVAFPEVVAALADPAVGDMVLDGEILALDTDGRPSFNALQNSGSARAAVVYYVFDLMILGGVDLRREPLHRRRQLLEEKVLPKLSEPVRYTATLDAPLSVLIESVKAQELEGLVAKRMDSRYESGLRSGVWQKMR